jgi:hypothetical protein
MDRQRDRETVLRPLIPIALLGMVTVFFVRLFALNSAVGTSIWWSEYAQPVSDSSST